MLEGPVLALTDQRRTAEEYGQQRDGVDDLHHRHEGRGFEIRIELRPDHEVHRRLGACLWTLEKGRELLRDDALDVTRTGGSLRHSGGVHVELDRGAPSPRDVSL